MWAYLYIGNDQAILPEEFITLKQCQMYGISPLELEKIDIYTLNAHWFLHNEEIKIKNAMKKRAKDRQEAQSKRKKK